MKTGKDGSNKSQGMEKERAAEETESSEPNPPDRNC